MGGVRIQDYPTAGYVRIEGLNYSYQFFKAFARDIPLNSPIKITKRDNDTLVVERLKEAPAPMPAPAIDKEIKIELPPQPEPSTVEVEAKLETEEVPQVYKRNMGRPRRHKMIEEAPEAKD